MTRLMETLMVVSVPEQPLKICLMNGYALSAEHPKVNFLRSIKFLPSLIQFVSSQGGRKMKARLRSGTPVRFTPPGVLAYIMLYFDY